MYFVRQAWANNIDTEIKWSIISKSVMMVIFVEFIDQLIDYPINRAILKGRGFVF